MIWCKCHALRVTPQYYTKQDIDTRNQYTIALKNLPYNYSSYDLSNIINETKAISIGVFRYNGSYKPKPWAYFTFKNIETLEAAKEKTFNLKGKDLEWIDPATMKDRCQKCAADNHKAKDCSTHASNSRGRNNVLKTIMAHYERFKPEGYKPKSHRSASNSRSRSRQRTYADTVKDSKNSSSSTNKPSNPDKGKGRDIPLE